MLLENRFDVPRPPAETWSILLDVPGIVGCIPGAELTTVEPDGTYKGRVAVRLGPVALKFGGTAVIGDIDEAARTAVIRAKGADTQGRGNAGATTRMRVEPSGDGSTVVVETDLQLFGMVAQYGRASGVIAAVAGEIVAAFAANLRAKLAQAEAVPVPGSTEAPAAATVPPPAPARPAGTIGPGLLWRAFLAWLRHGLIGAKR